MPEKTIPQNIDAEQSVLGSMFLTKKALQKALEGLISEDFYLDSHSKIFEAIKAVDDTFYISVTNIYRKYHDFSLSCRFFCFVITSSI